MWPPHHFQVVIISIAVLLPLLASAGEGDAVIQEGNWLTGEPAHGSIRLREEGISISAKGREDRSEHADIVNVQKVAGVSGGKSPPDPREGAGGDVLFNITLQLSGMDGPVPFVAYVGEDILAKVRRVSRSLGLEPAEAARLAEAAKEYAKAARALPVTELTLGDGGPEEAVKLEVFEGDKAPEIMERLAQAGKTEEESKGLLEEAVAKLQEKRLAPMVTFKAAWGTGLEEVISVYKDDDVKAVVRDFVVRNSLGLEEAELLAKTVSTEAFRRRAVPMLVIPVEIPGAASSASGPASEDLRIYFGDNLGDAVSSFAARRALSEGAAASLLEHVVKFAAKSSFVPFARYRPEFTGRQGEALPELQVWAQDDADEVVRAYAEAHALEPEQEALAREAVARQAVALGVAPVLSVGVNIRPPGAAVLGGESAAPLVVRLEIFEGDEIEAAVDRFVEQYRMGSEGRSSLLERAQQVAEAERLIPLLTVSRVVPGAESDVEVSVPVFDGDNPAANAAVAARSAGLDEVQAKLLAAAVLDEAKRARLLPVVILLQEDGGSESGGGEAPPDELEALEEHGRLVFKLFYGDDVADKVERFAAERALPADEKAELFRTASLEAAEAGVVPLLTVPITLPESSAPEPARGASSAAVVRHLEVFKGEDINAKVEAFASELRLDEATRALIQSHVVGVASKAGLLPSVTLGAPQEPAQQGPPPVLSIPVEVTVAGGVSTSMQVLEVFPGDNITAAVVKFGRHFQLPEDEVEELQGLVLLKAQEARLEPLLSIPIELPSEEGDAGGSKVASLDMFQGDTVDEAVATFVARHGLGDPAASVALDALLREAAVDSRLVPEFEVPIKAKAQGSSTIVEATFALFKGEDLGEAAKRFVEDHGLGAATLPKLLQFLEQQIMAMEAAQDQSKEGAGQAEPAKDELR